MFLADLFLAKLSGLLIFASGSYDADELAAYIRERGKQSNVSDNSHETGSSESVCVQVNLHWTFHASSVGLITQLSFRRFQEDGAE